MTILSTTSRNDYTGNNSTAAFSYTFKILAKTDLVVTKKDTSGVETTLVVDVDYTVSGVGADAGGTITLNAGNLPTGYALTIRRERPITQETSIRNQSTFFPSIHEDEFDSLVMIDQNQQEQLDRSLKLPETEVPSDLLTTLPKVADRVSKFLAFDSNGNPIASSGGISPAIPVSSFVQTVLDDVDAPSARTTLGAASSAQVVALIALLPPGTKIPFAQASVPTGWTQDTANNDKALRVVSGTGGGTGGTHGLSAPPSTSHTHGITSASIDHRHKTTATYNVSSTGRTVVIGNVFGLSGNSSGKSAATFAGTQTNNSSDQYQTTDAMDSNASHNHGGATFPDGPLAFYPQYVDVVIGIKD